MRISPTNSQGIFSLSPDTSNSFKNSKEDILPNRSSTVLYRISAKKLSRGTRLKSNLRQSKFDRQKKGKPSSPIPSIYN